jgi:MoaE-MoaD fusion protein
MDEGVTDSIPISVRLFAILRERAGTGALELRLAEGATVADALKALGDEPGLRDVLGRLPIRAAVNREYAPDDTVLSAGDELALIPPVSGGAGAPAGGRTHAEVSGEPLSADRVRSRVSDPAAGAIVVFEGVTREVDALDYEAYVEMARERIEQILALCVERHGLCGAAAAHRTGRVALGEPSVIVAVSAAHRAEAFAGAREAIDEIKSQAPIWKREIGSDGSAAWVEGERPASGVAGGSASEAGVGQPAVRDGAPPAGGGATTEVRDGGPPAGGGATTEVRDGVPPAGGGATADVRVEASSGDPRTGRA